MQLSIVQLCCIDAFTGKEVALAKVLYNLILLNGMGFSMHEIFSMRNGRDLWETCASFFFAQPSNEYPDLVQACFSHQAVLRPPRGWIVDIHALTAS